MTFFVPTAAAEFRRILDVPIELRVRIGRVKMTLSRALELRPGELVRLNHGAEQALKLEAGGRVIALGDPVIVDDEVGLRVSDVVRREEPGPLVAPHDGPALPQWGRGEMGLASD